MLCSYYNNLYSSKGSPLQIIGTIENYQLSPNRSLTFKEY